MITLTIATVLASKTLSIGLVAVNTGGPASAPVVVWYSVVGGNRLVPANTIQVRGCSMAGGAISIAGALVSFNATRSGHESICIVDRAGAVKWIDGDSKLSLSATLSPDQQYIAVMSTRNASYSGSVPNMISIYHIRGPQRVALFAAEGGAWTANSRFVYWRYASQQGMSPAKVQAGHSKPGADPDVAKLRTFISERNKPGYNFRLVGTPVSNSVGPSSYGFSLSQDFNWCFGWQAKELSASDTPTESGWGDVEADCLFDGHGITARFIHERTYPPTAITFSGNGKHLLYLAAGLTKFSWKNKLTVRKGQLLNVNLGTHVGTASKLVLPSLAYATFAFTTK